MGRHSSPSRSTHSSSHSTSTKAPSSEKKTFAPTLVNTPPVGSCAPQTSVSTVTNLATGMLLGHVLTNSTRPTETQKHVHDGQVDEKKTFFNCVQTKTSELKNGIFEITKKQESSCEGLLHVARRDGNFGDTFSKLAECLCKNLV